MYYTPNMSRGRIVCEDSAALIMYEIENNGFGKPFRIVFESIRRLL